MERKLDIIGVQIDLGASRKGVDMGPLAIRHAGLARRLSEMGFSVHDNGDVVPAVAEEEGDPKLRYAAVINDTNERLYRAVAGILAKGSLPVVIGGDHSAAAGSVPAVSDHYDAGVGVLWIDAHGDFNDEISTPSGNMHGMPLSAVCGCGPECMVSFAKTRIDPGHVAIIGARALDPQEVIRLKDAGVTVFSISDIHTMGMPEIMRTAIEVATEGGRRLHVSFDMDALEPAEAPGVGTPVTNGLTLREAFIATEFIHRSGRLCSMDLVEVNPLLDVRNQTGSLAVDIIASALGSTQY